MTDSGRRIAMWSGPRNISTAMMRSWENRPDTIVCDEPLYAHYLKETGAQHPGADEIIAANDTDWRNVVDWLTAPVNEGAAIFYQKHMAHHLLPKMDEEWLDEMTNCFLIREPKEMITSLVRFIPRPSLEDTGLPQQVRIFKRVAGRIESTPPVLDAQEVLENPRSALRTLCNAIDIEFSEDMLNWPAGPRDTDGLWEKYWYSKIATTTSFCEFQPKGEAVPEALTNLLEQCNELYGWLFERRLRW